MTETYNYTTQCMQKQYDFFRELQLECVDCEIAISANYV